MICRICKKTDEDVTFSLSTKDTPRKHCDICDVRVKADSKKFAEYNKAKAKKWREENPEQYKETLQKCYDRRKDEIKEYKKEWYQNNKDKAKASQDRNRDKIRLRNKNTRYKRKQVNKETENPVTLKELNYIKAEYGDVCIYCFGLGDTIEHVLPLCKGGKNNIQNIVIACRSCNCSKGGKLFSDWWTFEKEEMYGNPMLRIFHDFNIDNFK